MRIYYLAGVILSVTTILSACGGEPTTCTISTTKDLRQGVIKSAKFAAGTDCEAMRVLAEEGKPLPSIADAASITTVQKAPATPTQAAFSTPFVSGQKTQDLIATTDKQARVRELESRINANANQSRDPFISAAINPVPKLETILARPKNSTVTSRAPVIVTTATRPNFTAPAPRPAPRPAPPRPAPIPPNTTAAEGTKVTGTVEIAGTIYAILNAFEEPTSRYVRVGQLISNGKVLVKRIDTNSEPPIVILQQNGVEVLRPVGAPVIVSINTQVAPPSTGAGVVPAAPVVPASPPQATTAPFTIPFLVPPQAQ